MWLSSKKRRCKYTLLKAMSIVHPKESRQNEAHIKQNEEALSTCMCKKL